jgi:hypothetical protein
LARKGIILCGNWTLPLTKLAEALRIDLHQSRETDESKIPATEIGRQQFQGIEMIEQKVRQYGRLNLLGLLKNAGVAWASNPVDYLYGVLGIAEEEDEAELQPDYAEPVHDTLRRFAKYFVLKERALEMLSYVNPFTWAPGQPTWIPNRASQNDRRTMWRLSLDPPFRAAGASSFEMTLVDVVEMDAFWSVVKGVVVDNVGVVGLDHRSKRVLVDGTTISDLPRDQIKE